MPNLQVTYVEPQSVCFCGYRLCELQAARAMTVNLYSRGILRFKETLSQGHQTRYMGTPWQGLFGAV